MKKKEILKRLRKSAKEISSEDRRTPYMCVATHDNRVSKFLIDFLEESPDYIRDTGELGAFNFTNRDGFGYLTIFERQLARSLMILMVMEANK